MIWMNVRSAMTGALLVTTAACGLLDVSDPTAIEDDELTNAAGADLLRRDALRQLHIAFAEGALASGMLADEFMADPPMFSVVAGTMTAEEMLDRRRSEDFEEYLAGTPTTGVYIRWKEARRGAITGITRYRPYANDSRLRAHLGEMLAARAFVTLKLAEDFCAGFPLHDIFDYQPVYGGPHTTDEAFAIALADLDTAFTYAADSARILDLVHVARGRALLGLGRFSEAAAAVAAVQTEYQINAEFTDSWSPLWNPLDFAFFRTRSVADGDGEVGMDFVSAGDPRVATTLVAMANDGVTGLYKASKYSDAGAPIVLASGIEARLIEAEAALRAGASEWLAILNELRTTGITPPLAALGDPGNEAARVDLLFRERAFWLFGTGHRLADLRRLIRHYGRAAETVLPSGAYRIGGEYAAATSIPFPAALEAPFNPLVTGCTSR